MKYHKERLIGVIAATVALTVLLIVTPLVIALSESFDELARELKTAKISASAGVGRAERDADDYEELPTVKEKTPQEPETLEPATMSLGTFKLTAYCACEQCCGEWANGITYTGTEATPDRTIAVDPSVIPLGSTIYINGQDYIAEDIGGAIKGNRIDIFFPTHNEALQFGVQYAEVVIHSNNTGGLY